VSPLNSLIDRIKSSPLISRLVHGAFWSVLGAVLARALGLATWMVVARILGTRAFGELGIVQNTFGLLQNLSLLGLGIMATKYVAQYRASEKQRAGRVVGLSVLLAAGSGLLMGIGVVLAAPWIASRVLGAPQLTVLLQIGGILIVAAAVGGVLEGALAGFEAFKPLAILGLVGGLVSLPLFVWAAWAAGLEGLVWSMVGVALLMLGLNYWVLHRTARREQCAVTFSGVRQELRAIFNFGLPVFLSGQVFFLAEWLGSWLLIRMPSGFDELGVYSAAVRWQQAVLFIPLYLSRAVFPGLTDRYASGDYSRFKRLLKYYTLACTGVAVVCAIALSLLSKLVMSGYGPEFTEGWPVLVIASVSMVFLPLRWAIQMIYRSIGAAWYELFLSVAWAVLMLIGMLVLHGRGSLRLALSTAIAFALTTLIGAVHIGLRLRRTVWQASKA
jgi:O-antigen/teichoic acid export membrane protein